jgi:hypothetical protein
MWHFNRDMIVVCKFVALRKQMFSGTQEAAVGLLSYDLVFFLHHPMVFLLQTSGR